MQTPPTRPNPKLRPLKWASDVARPNWFYRGMRRLFQVCCSAFWRTRAFNRHFEPAEGGVVYICNHQSFLDPILMSYALRRPMNYMARDSLFRIAPFRWIIEALNAFPVRRGKADTKALKESMRRLKSGGQVVVFAEGTRTRDGRIRRFLPGVAMLSQRAADWTVPVVIDGAFDAWPRTQAVPGGGFIDVQYLPPISREEARKHSPQEFVDMVRNRMIDVQNQMRRRRGRAEYDYAAE